MNTFKTVATNIALQAGEIMRANFSIGMKRMWKKDFSPVTETDIAINRLVIETIQSEFPGHGIVGEEQSFEGKGEYVWVCDPVDGTIPFSHGYPTCAFSLALTKNGVPFLGIIYDAMMRRLIIAEKGKGAYLNDQKIHVSHAKKIANTSLIDLSGGNSLQNLREKLLQEKHCYVMTLYSTVYGGLLVASGEILAEIYGYSYPWDGAAIKVVIEEAGGKVTDLAGNEQRYDRVPINGFIASNGLVHQELIDVIRST